MLKKSSVKEPVKAAVIKSPSESKEQLMTKVKAKAYELWEKQGKKNGQDRAHWFAAEKAVSNK